jgi:hypothetical protein
VQDYTIISIHRTGHVRPTLQSASNEFLSSAKAPCIRFKFMAMLMTEFSFDSASTV